MKTKVLLIATTAILLLATAALATQPNFEQIARSYIPADAVLERTEWDDGLTEVQFRSPDNSVEYDVKIDPATQSVVQVEYDVRNDRGSQNVLLTDQQAKEHVLALYPSAEVVSVLLERDDGLQEYVVLFNAPGFTGKVELNPETGAVLDRSLDYTRTGETASGPLTAEQAKELVLSRVTNGRIIEFETDREDGRTVYEGEVVAEKLQYDFEIDAETGVILQWERD